MTLSETEFKSQVVTGSMLGSFFMFSSSLFCVNNILHRHKVFEDGKHVNKLLIVNGITMIFSGTLFSYVVHKCIS